MANELDIDKISIQIETDVGNAPKKIEELATSLESLSNSLNGLEKLSTLADNLTRVSNAVNSIDTAKIESLATSIQALSNVSTIDDLLANLANSLANFNNSLSGLDLGNIDVLANRLLNLTSVLSTAPDVSGFTSQLQILANSLTQLSTLENVDFTGLVYQINLLNNLDLTNLSNQINILVNSGILTLIASVTELVNAFTQLMTVISPLTGLFGNITNSFNNLNIGIGNSTKNLNSFNTAATSANSASTALLGTVGSLATKFMAFYGVALLVSRVLGDLFEESSQYIENLNKFNVAMGDATESAYEYANVVSEAMGIDAGEWMDYQGTFNMLVRGFGVSSDAAQTMSQNLTQLAYDYSSLMNVDVEEAADKLNSAMSGQIKGLKEYGNNVSVAMVKQTGLKYGLEGSVSDWDQATQATMRYITIMENAANVDVFNDMARTINTPANAMRILNQQFTVLKRNLGNIVSVLATRIIPYVQIVVELLSELASWIATLLGWTGSLDIDYSGLSSDTDLSDGTDDLADSADSASDAVDGTTESVEELKKTLMGFDELNIIASPDSDSGSSSGSSGSGGSGGSSGVDLSSIELPEYDFLAGLESDANATIERIKNQLLDLFEPLTNSWDKYGSGVMESMEYAFTSILDLAGDIGQSWYEVWKNGTGEETCDHILSICESIFDTIGDIASGWDEAWNTDNVGTQIIQNLWDALNNILGIVDEVASGFSILFDDTDWYPLLSAIENLTGRFSDLTALLEEDLRPIIEFVFQELLEPLLNNFIQVVLPNFINLISDIIGLIVDLGQLFKDIGDTLNGLFSGDFTATWESLGDVWKDVQKIASDLLSTLDDILNTLTNGTWENVKTFIYDHFVEPLEHIPDVAESMKDFVSDLWDGFVQGIEDFFSNPLDFLKENVVDPIINAIKKLFGIASPSTVMKEIGGYVIEGLWEGIKQGVSDFLGGIGDLIWGAFEGIGDFFSGITIDIGAALGDGWETVKGVWNSFQDTTVYKTISGAIGTAWSGIQSAWGSITDGSALKTISGAASTAWNTVKGAWDAVVDSPVVKTVTGAFGTAWSTVTSAWEGVKNTTTYKTISGVTSSAFSSVKNTWETVKNSTVVKTASGTVQTAFTSLKDKWDSVKTKTSTLTGTAKNAASSVFSTLKGAWNTVTTKTSTLTGKSKNNNSSVLSTLKSAWSTITTKTSTVTGKAKNNNSSTLKTLKDSWDKIKTKTATLTATVTGSLTSWISAIVAAFKAEGGILVNGQWKDVAKYASGGSPNMGQMFIAREAGPELVGTINGNTAVMNNQQIVSSVAAGVAQAVAGVMSSLNNNNNNGGDITVNVVMDSKTVGKAVVNYNNDIVKRTGSSPLLT